jgi:glutamyl-tRNA reductase
MSQPPTERPGEPARTTGDSASDADRNGFGHDEERDGGEALESVSESCEFGRENATSVSDSKARDAWRTVRADSEAVRREQLQRALSKLESQGRLTDEQRRTVERLSASIVEGVLSTCRPPRADDDGDGSDVERALIELFGGES